MVKKCNKLSMTQHKDIFIQFPESSATLPAELAELSFDEEDFDDDDDDDDDAEEGEEDEDDEERDESNRTETSDDNEEGNVQNEDEEVTTATEDEEAGEDAAAAALNRNRMLDLEGWFLGELRLFHCRCCCKSLKMTAVSSKL